MIKSDDLEPGFLAAIAARLAGHDWPAAALERLTQGGGGGLVSALEDLLAALHRLGDEDLGNVAPEVPF